MALLDSLDMQIAIDLHLQDYQLFIAKQKGKQMQIVYLVKI